MEGKYLKNHKRCLSHLAKNSESIRQEVGAMQRQLGSFDKKKGKETGSCCLSRTCCRLIVHIHDIENDCDDQK